MVSCKRWVNHAPYDLTESDCVGHHPSLRWCRDRGMEPSSEWAFGAMTLVTLSGVTGAVRMQVSSHWEETCGEMQTHLCGARMRPSGSEHSGLRSLQRTDQRFEIDNAGCQPDQWRRAERAVRFLHPRG